MPELPEVETITRQLGEQVLGQRVKGVEILDPKLQGKGIERIRTDVITSLRRRGKNIIIGFETGLYLIAHPRMTGKFLWHPDGHSLQHLRAVFQLSGGDLCWVDQRRFGSLMVSEDLRLLSGLGVEPLSPEFTDGYLYRIGQRSSRQIKELLMDQRRIAGIGNIYAAEILFSAGIHPQRRANTLSREEIAILVQRTRVILSKAVEERGTTIADYLDTRGDTGGYQKLLQVYGRAGFPCPHCGRPIERIRQSGRSTYYCPHCQMMR